MISLFIDTSNADVSIAIIKDGKLLNLKQESIPNEHSIYTVEYVDEVLKKSNLDANSIDNIMVVSGPGSFTGLRIGLTIAKTYAYLLKKDIILVSSLKMLALSTEGETILSLIDAKHNNYYLGLYDKNYDSIIEEKFSNKEEIDNILKEYPDSIIMSDSEIDIPNSKVNKLDFAKIWDYYKDKKEPNIYSVVPNYLKLPQAMEDRK